MYFYFGDNISNFMFENLNIESTSAMVIACVLVFMLVVAFELMKATLSLANYKYALFSKAKVSRSDDSLISNPTPRSKTKSAVFITSAVGLYFVELVLGYTIMLIVMTFNASFFIVAVVASVLIYFFTGQQMLDVQRRRTELKKGKPIAPARQNVGESPSMSTDEINSVSEGTTKSCCSSNAEVGLA